MSWYAESPALRSRQLLLDAAVLVWVLLWLRVGAAVHGAVDRLNPRERTLSDRGPGGFPGTAGQPSRQQSRQAAPSSGKAVSTADPGCIPTHCVAGTLTHRRGVPPVRQAG